MFILKVILCVVSEAAFGSVSVSGAPQRTSKPTCTVSGASAHICWGMSMGRVTMSQPRAVQILEEFFDCSGRPVKLMA